MKVIITLIDMIFATVMACIILIVAVLLTTVEAITAIVSNVFKGGAAVFSTIGNSFINYAKRRRDYILEMYTKKEKKDE